jgi:hypothetical protein
MHTKMQLKSFRIKDMLKIGFKTYKWIRFDAFESSDGSWPLNELLFMWLQRWKKHWSRKSNTVFVDDAFGLEIHLQVFNMDQISKWFWHKTWQLVFIYLESIQICKVAKLIW